MDSRPLRLALKLGLFQFSLGILGVLILGLLNRLLILVFVGIGTAIAAGGTAFAALIADRTTEAERPRVLSAVAVIVVVGCLDLFSLVNDGTEAN